MQEIRDAFNRILEKSKDADLPPHVMADLLVKLTSLYASLSTEVQESSFAYKAVLFSLLDSEEAASRAKIRAENSEAYRRMVGAQTLEKVCLELIRSMKVALRTKGEERRYS